MKAIYSERGYRDQQRCEVLVEKVLESGHLTEATCEELRRRAGDVSSDEEAGSMVKVLQALEGAFSMRGVHLLPMSGRNQEDLLKRARAVAFGKAVVVEILAPGALDLAQVKKDMEGETRVEALLEFGEMLEKSLGEVVAREYGDENDSVGVK